MTEIRSVREKLTWGGSLLALLVLALGALGTLVVWPQFDGLYGQDPFAYYGYALGPLDRALHRGAPPPPFFWPPGFPLLVWLVAGVVGPTPLAGQVVALAAGGAVPLLTALLAWELFGARADTTENKWLPLLAGTLVAFHGQLWQSSVVVMADTPALATGTAGVWLTARWGRTGRPFHLWLGAGFLAFAVLTRWAYGLVSIPVTCFVLSRMAKSFRVVREDSSTVPARPALQALGAALVVLAILAPVWLPAALESEPGGRRFTGNFEVYRWHPANVIRRTFETADGLLRYRLPNGLYYLLTPAHPYFFTPLIAPFLVPGSWRLWTLRNSSRCWLLVGWAVVVLGFHAGAAYQNFRFTLAFLPPLAILCGIGMTTVWAWLGKKLQQDRTQRAARVALVAWVAAGLAAMTHGGVRLTRSFVERKAADLATVEWVEERTPSDARVLAFNFTFTLDHYSSRETAHLFNETPATMDSLAASDRPIFVLLETESFMEQWVGHRSWKAFKRLREMHGLEEVGRDRDYVLYRVGSTP